MRRVTRCPAPGVSRCVPRYGRDDVELQLRCQRQVVDAIDREWVPYVPVDRGPSPMSQGAHSPVVAENLRDPLEVNSDARTEPESKSEAETAFSSDCSDGGAVESVASADSLQKGGRQRALLLWCLAAEHLLWHISQGHSQCAGGLSHACMPSCTMAMSCGAATLALRDSAHVAKRLLQ